MEKERITVSFNFNGPEEKKVYDAMQKYITGNTKKIKNQSHVIRIALIKYLREEGYLKTELKKLGDEENVRTETKEEGENEAYL